MEVNSVGARFRQCAFFAALEVVSGARGRHLPCGRLRTRRKLGTSALALLALQFEPLASLFEEHRRGLRQTLLALQNASGWFEPSISPDQPQGE